METAEKDSTVKANTPLSNSFTINSNNKNYSLKIYTEGNLLKISIIEINKFLHAMFSFNKTYNIESLKVTGTLFQSCATVEQALSYMSASLKRKKYKLTIEGAQAILFIFISSEYNNLEASLIIPIERKKDDEVIQTISDNLYKLNKKCKEKESQIEELLATIKVNEKLKERVKVLEEENSELKNEVKYLKTAIFLPILRISGDLVYKTVIASSLESLKLLSCWVGKGKSFDTTLLYKATRDGDKCSIVNDKHVNQGPTLCLIKSTEGRCFGGFAQESFSLNKWEEDKNSFIFSLDTHEIFMPKDKYCIYCSPKHIVWFGSCGAVGIYCDDFLSRKDSGYSSVKESTYDTTPAEKSLNNGKNRFSVKELEIYKIQFK